MTRFAGSARLLLPILVLLSPRVPRAADAPVPIDALVVRDAQGATVGKVQSLEGPAGATVALDVSGQLVVVRVTRERFLGNADCTVYFESEDCSGAAYTTPGCLSIGPSLVAVVVSGPGSTVYSGSPDAVGLPYSFRSDYRPGGGVCINERLDEPVAIEVLPVVELSQFFSPPFSLAAVETPSPPAPTATAPPPSTATPTLPPPYDCCGDCGGDGSVTVDDLVTAVNSALRSECSDVGIQQRRDASRPGAPP